MSSTFQSGSEKTTACLAEKQLWFTKSAHLESNLIQHWQPGCILFGGRCGKPPALASAMLRRGGRISGNPGPQCLSRSPDGADGAWYFRISSTSKLQNSKVRHWKEITPTAQPKDLLKIPKELRQSSLARQCSLPNATINWSMIMCIYIIYISLSIYLI